MSRDPRKLRVFLLADALVVDVYKATRVFPAEERFLLAAQTRRAALSVATNIVEGCARRRTKEYLNFLNIAAGSSAEARYLLDVAFRLGMMRGEVNTQLSSGYTELFKGLQKLIISLDRQNLTPKAQSPKPEAWNVEPGAPYPPNRVISVPRPPTTDLAIWSRLMSAVVAMPCTFSLNSSTLLAQRSASS